MILREKHKTIMKYLSSEIYEHYTDWMCTKTISVYEKVNIAFIHRCAVVM